MSRFNRLWVLLVPMVLLFAGLGVTTPAHADEAWIPPDPTVRDACGTSTDASMLASGTAETAWFSGTEVAPDYSNFLPTGEWIPTEGASTVTVTAKDFSTSSGPSKTFTLTFGTEPNSTCVEAADTVTAVVGACDQSTGRTNVTFTYTNTDDATNLPHTRPTLVARRIDGVTTQVVFSYGTVADGDQVVVVDDLGPGTRELTLTTNETGTRKLANRFFVPACGGYQLPPGDPMGGPIVTPPPVVSRPTATISACNVRTNRVRVLLDARKATATVKYRLVVDPRRGKTVVRTYYVSAKNYKTVVLYKQRTGTLVKVSFAGKVVQRRLRC